MQKLHGNTHIKIFVNIYVGLFGGCQIAGEQPVSGEYPSRGYLGAWGGLTILFSFFFFGGGGGGEGGGFRV